MCFKGLFFMEIADIIETFPERKKFQPPSVEVSQREIIRIIIRRYEGGISDFLDLWDR